MSAMCIVLHDSACLSPRALDERASRCVAAWCSKPGSLKLGSSTTNREAARKRASPCGRAEHCYSGRCDIGMSRRHKIVETTGKRGGHKQD